MRGSAQCKLCKIAHIGKLIMRNPKHLTANRIAELAARYLTPERISGASWPHRRTVTVTVRLATRLATGKNKSKYI